MRKPSSDRGVLLSLTIFLMYVMTTQSMQYCYQCNSNSDLCRESVYDGQYLSIYPCRTKCFLRSEGALTYRGCFDTWENGLVNDDYEGCMVQHYLGQNVEWCFCRGGVNKEKAPCNGAPRDVIARISPQLASQPDSSAAVVMERFAKSGQDGYYMPLKNGNYGAKDGFEIEVQYDDDATPSPRNAPNQARGNGMHMEAVHEMYGDEELPKFNCYSCHDDSPFCKDEITDPTTIAIAPCRSKCFIRYENEKIYRGCFDGWLSTELAYDYQGCRQQVYLDQTVEWCLCKADLCNARSMGAMSKGNIGAMALTTQLPLYMQQEAAAAAAAASASLRMTEHVGGYKNVIGAGSQAQFTWQQPQREKSGSAYVSAQKTNYGKPSDSMTGLCRGYYDGIYPDSSDCSRFVQCINGFTYRRRCPPGTLWSRGYGRCDYPASVGYDCASDVTKQEAEPSLSTDDAQPRAKDPRPAIGYN